MTTSKVRRAIAAVLCLACVALILVGAVNLPKKNAQAGQTILNDLRTRALLNVTGEGVVESYVNIAKKQAQEKAKAENAGMAGIREAVAKAEEDTRAKYANAEFTSGVTATPALEAAATRYNELLRLTEMSTMTRQLPPWKSVTRKCWPPVRRSRKMTSPRWI